MNEHEIISPKWWYV